MIGPSRKSFLKKEQQDDTEFATAGAVAASVLNGAHIVRVHDVKAMKSVVEVVDVIRQAAYAEAEQPVTQAVGIADNSAFRVAPTTMRRIGVPQRGHGFPALP